MQGHSTLSGVFVTLSSPREHRDWESWQRIDRLGCLQLYTVSSKGATKSYTWQWWVGRWEVENWGTISSHISTVFTEINRIHHWCSEGTGKSQPEGPPFQWEMRVAEFPNATVDPRVGIFLSTLNINDQLFFSHTIIEPNNFTIDAFSLFEHGTEVIE